MFFPTMRKFTLLHFQAPSFTIIIKILLFSPTFTFIRLVLKDSKFDQFSSKILLIVCIVTMKPVMLVIERTHNCFKFKNIKTLIFVKFMKKRYSKFILFMNKRAEISVFTFFNFIIVLAIFSLESIWMVHLFNYIV